jgi:hypothetical protein
LKPNSRSELPQANRIFTDREEPRKAFWNAYSTFKEGLGAGNDIKILSYYGIGGIGKSKLLVKLQHELDEKIGKPKYTAINLEHIKTPRSVLEAIRNNLSHKFNFKFPVFDLAVYIYARKIGENVTDQEIKTIISKSPILEDVFGILGDLPVIGMGAKLVSLADKGVAAIRTIISSRRIEITEIENETPDLILNKLPYYFAGDLSDNLKNTTEPLVIFFDTYEALVNELSGTGDPLKNDEWLRNDIYGLVTNTANVLWVIAGRERIKWSQFNKEWEEAIEQHRLGDLSEADSDFFLKEAGISDALLRNSIYQLTNGTPVYLDLCVENYYMILSKGYLPNIQDIGKNKT